MPYTVSCNNGCSASVAPVDDPFQRTLGNLPGCACGTFLPDASSARAVVRRCSCAVTATAGRSIALRVAPRRRADSRNARPASATRAALPFKESLVHGARAAKALVRKRLPLAASAQNVHHSLEDLPRRLDQSPSTTLAGEHLVWWSAAPRYQRLDSLPEVIRDDPKLDPLPRRCSTPTLRNRQLETKVS